MEMLFVSRISSSVVVVAISVFEPAPKTLTINCHLMNSPVKFGSNWQFCIRSKLFYLFIYFHIVFKLQTNVWIKIKLSLSFYIQYTLFLLPHFGPSYILVISKEEFTNKLHDFCKYNVLTLKFDDNRCAWRI